MESGYAKNHISMVHAKVFIALEMKQTSFVLYPSAKQSISERLQKGFDLSGGGISTNLHDHEMKLYL